MIACLASGVLAVGFSIVFGSQFLIYSIPGIVVGAFFAFKYATFDRNKARQEEHKRRRKNRH
jgi:hypothetical protein